eukprot:Ihof_evm6s437 gene=Ihof_evmTU6s437
MNHSNVSHYFWDHALRATIFTHNLSLTKAVSSDETPYTLWTKGGPLVECLRAFDCNVIYRLDDFKIESNFLPRGRLGYILRATHSEETVASERAPIGSPVSHPTPSQPSKDHHWDMCRHVLMYLNTYKDGVLYCKGLLKMLAYSDADFEASLTDTK